MTDDEKIRAKERAIEVRRWGGDLEDCALLAGISVDTLANWRKEDTYFSEDLQAAWANYKLDLIRSVRKDKPDFLLQSDFRKRFGKVEEQNRVTNNLIVIGDDKLEEFLYGFTRRLVETQNTGATQNNVDGGQSNALSANNG